MSDRGEWYHPTFCNDPPDELYFTWSDDEFGIHCRICDDYLGVHGTEPRDFLCKECNVEMGC